MNTVRWLLSLPGFPKRASVDSFEFVRCDVNSETATVLWDAFDDVKYQQVQIEEVPPTKAGIYVDRKKDTESFEQMAALLQSHAPSDRLADLVVVKYHLNYYNEVEKMCIYWGQVK